MPTNSVKKNSASATKVTTKKPLVAKEPQSKQEAALKAGMFLHTDDAWSKAYFNKADLHFKERVIFG